MAKNLVIVESPAKAKTIEKFLGTDYKVESSFGHIADLPTKELGVDVEGDFTPKYTVNKDKKTVVKKLRDLADKAEMVWLASDEDREGEAIAWHLAEELKLDKNKTKRIVFSEITSFFACSSMWRRIFTNQNQKPLFFKPNFPLNDLSFEVKFLVLIAKRYRS